MYNGGGGRRVGVGECMCANSSACVCVRKGGGGYVLAQITRAYSSKDISVERRVCVYEIAM